MVRFGKFFSEKSATLASLMCCGVVLSLERHRLKPVLQTRTPGSMKSRASVYKLTGRLPSLPHTRACSTIGAERLNFRVRDGNGWIPLAKVTQNLAPSCFQKLSDLVYRFTNKTYA